jgi:large subunit ribosomal protein L9
MPEAILLKDVDTLGEQGNVVEVSKGYLRNYLIPRKLAQPATKGAIETVRQRQAAVERAAREAVERAQENNRTVLTIPQQAGADGRLFGSVTAQDIAGAIREARGLRLDKRNVHLPEPIKNVGTYMVVVDVVEGVQATIKTMVVAKK